MRVSAIIPAYNEEKRIGTVLQPVIKSSIITDIIVIDDGSDDRTCQEVSMFSGIKLIKFKCNKGKAEALKAGLKDCQSEIIVFLDADLIGLSTEHIESLIKPLVIDDYEMTIGVFKSGRFFTSFAQKLTPCLSGQRAFKKSLIQNIIDLDMSGYNAEIAISKMLRDDNIKTVQVPLEGISHAIKEEKFGLTKGLYWRIKMYKDIVKYMIH
ncbi:glycosyltransferase [Serpentinicella sp. ANB-PHB4]|uniref:glycosyltransferase family 2 protein n=1 Tax=Serpentinicella sp. ANB-PHB4 TaxID=3074076 RepID=UPI0028583A3E|nr:glycosyltransferase [Serpentinicella sp. ANB-PHB4]MDR5658226.1 glycosyltransferase [Serpentinicella sp. ANB-PHB4]